MTHGIVRPSACLDPEALGALAEGGLAGAERDAAVRHLATCRRCHEVFASSVQILEGEGALPVVSEGTAAPAPIRRPSVMLWLSTAAAALVSAVVFVQRAPVLVPRIAEASPSPVVTPPVATASPTPPPVQAASLPPEAIEALRTLGGFQSPYAVPRAVGFARDPRKDAVRLGIEDVDSAARAFADGKEVPVPAGAVDPWRRVGRILEASRLVLLAQRRPDAFFASSWVETELEQAGRLLTETGSEDASWLQDLRQRSIAPDDAEALLDRLDRLLRRLS